MHQLDSRRALQVTSQEVHDGNEHRSMGFVKVLWLVKANHGFWLFAWRSGWIEEAVSCSSVEPACNMHVFCLRHSLTSASRLPRRLQIYHCPLSSNRKSIADHLILLAVLTVLNRRTIDVFMMEDTISCSSQHYEGSAAQGKF